MLGLRCRGWKGVQIYAADQLLTAQWSSGPRARTNVLSLELTAALVYRVNAMHSRPSTGSAFHRLLRSSLPLTEDRGSPYLISGRDDNPQGWRERDDFHEPFAEQGIIWLRDLRLPDDGGAIQCPRFPKHWEGQIHPQISPRHYKALLGFTYEALQHELGRSQGHRRPAPDRLPRASAMLPSARAPGPNDPVPAFNFSEEVAKNVNADFDEGSDLDDGEIIADTAGEDTARLNHEVQRILLNYGSQVLGAIPNPRQSADVYHELRRGLASTEEATLAHHQTAELHINAFTQIATREPHHDDWDDCFMYLFPPKDMVRRPHTSVRAKHRQPPGVGEPFNFVEYGGYKLCPFHTEWQQLMERSTPSAAAEIRHAVKREFNKFTWAPWATSHRMWTTGKDKRLDVVRGDSIGHGVHLCINPKFRGVLTWGGSLLFDSQRI